MRYLKFMGFLMTLLGLSACGRMRNADFGGSASMGFQGPLVGNSTRKIAITGQTEFPARTCAGLTVRTEDEYSNERAVETQTSILLSTSGDGVFHSASDCSAASRTNTVVLDSGESNKPVYYFSNRGEVAPVLSASAPSSTLSAGSLTVNPIPAPITSMAVLGPRAGRIGVCIGPFTLQFRNADHLPELATEPTRVDFTLNPTTTLHTSSLCTNPSTFVTVPAQQNSVNFYLQSTAALVETLTATSTTLGLNRTTQVSFSSQFTRFTQVAGKPNPHGFADGNGLSQARFMGPSKLTNDGTHVYVVDNLSYIRRYHPVTGQVTTVVGNPEDLSSSLFRDGYGPLLRTEGGGLIRDLTADAAFVYFVYHSCVRRMNVQTLDVETIVGSCETSGSLNGIGMAARLPTLNYITLDPVLRRLYVANLSSVWKVDLETLDTRLLAGDSSITGDTDGTGITARFNLNQGGILVRSNGKLILGEFTKIRELNPETLVVTTLQSGVYHQENMVAVGGTYYSFNSAQTEYLRSFTLDPYTSQYPFFNMLYASRDGDPSTGSITGARGLTALGNTLYFAESHTGLLRKFDLTPSPITVSTVAGSNGFDYGGTTTVDFKGRATNLIASSGNDLYVGDRTNCNIRRMEISTSAVTLVAGSTSVPFTNDRCVPVDGVGTDARFSNEIGLGVVSGNYLYLSDSGKIRRVDLASAGFDVTTIAGSEERNPAADGLRIPVTLSTTAGSNTATVLSGNTALLSPQMILTGFSGIPSGTKISSVNPISGTIVLTQAATVTSASVDLAATSAILPNPGAMVVMGSDLYFTDGYTIRKLDLTTLAVTTVAGNATSGGTVDGAAASARFTWISGLARDGLANALLISDQYTIRRLDLTSLTVTRVAGSPYPQIVLDGDPVNATFMNIRGMSYVDFSGDWKIYIYDDYGLRVLDSTLGGVYGTVMSLDGTTQSSPARVDRNGLLHEASTSPLGYFVNLLFMPDGALYLPTGQGIRKLH